MRRRIIAISASALAILGLTAGTTLATTPYTLDQKQELTAGGTSAWIGSMVLAQTFTPSITGPLSEVDVYVAVTVTPNTQAGVVPAAPSSLMVQIVTTDAGDHFPTTTVVESANLSPSGDPGWTPVSFGTPKPVTAGTVYAIVITPTSGYNLGWSGTCSGGQYSPGEALMMDAGFGWRTVTNWAAAHGGNSEVYCQQDFAFREYILPVLAKIS